MAGGFGKDGAASGDGVQAVYLETADGALVEIFPLNYSYQNSCALLGSPAESGMMQYDHKVIQPSAVNFTGIVKYEGWKALSSIRAAIRSMNLENMKCTFYTKARTAKNMMAESIEEIGNNTRYDAVEIKVVLKEFLEHNST